MPAASTLQRRGVTSSILWVWYELMTLLEIDNLLIEWVVFQSLIWTNETCGQVSKIVRHPQFDAKRLSDDIAVMITSRVVGEDFLVETSTKLLVSSFTIQTLEASRRQNKTIFADLQHPYVSPACFPSCQQQFDHVFSNGTGARFRLLHHLHNCLDLQQLS